jgi:hypothetical protein
MQFKRYILCPISLLFLSSFVALGQSKCQKDTMFKWNNLRLISLGLEAGSGYFNNNKLEIDNFKTFVKIEFGARVYLKKFVLGWRGSFLLSGNKNSGNVNNINVNGKFENRQSTMYVGFMVTSPKYILIEPAIYYSFNKGLLFYDSLKYGGYTNNYPTATYKLRSIGIGFNSYINLNSITPKVMNGYPLYIYTQLCFLMPTQDKYSNGGFLQNLSIGITFFPFFYKSRHF